MFWVFSLHPAALLHILAGAGSSIQHKILVKVRLIMEPRLMRDLSRIGGLGDIHQAQRVLKPEEPGNFLRWDDQR